MSLARPNRAVAFYDHLVGIPGAREAPSRDEDKTCDALAAVNILQVALHQFLGVMMEPAPLDPKIIARGG
jgi:hypothetical protein